MPQWYVYESESEVAQSCPTLCDPVDCSLPGSSVHGIFQAIVLEWIAISFSRGSSRPRDRTWVSLIVDRCFTIWATREVRAQWYVYAAAAAKSLQSCPTLCDPMDRSLPGSSVHGIFQARVLEWVAIAFSGGTCTVSTYLLNWMSDGLNNYENIVITLFYWLTVLYLLWLLIDGQT